ncbi:putative DNA binding protein 1 [Bacillus phage BSP36]|nr:putative DNA binding protein 1 [Bacillus phage BSP36]
MEYGVYLESSIVDLKPRVLDFLTKIVEKAKEVKDFAISIKKKELAELAGKDTRTVSRYLSELEKRHIIETKGVRGRSGGTVILFNTELIRFDTSDKAFINSEEPITIDDIVEKKMPKKEKEPKKKTRNRRTKLQMLEANLLKSEKQKKIDKLNDEVNELGGVPNWGWFQKTEDPIGNYRTYLLSRVYNRYAVLFTDRHNAEVSYYGEGNLLPEISNDYDVLPAEFFGSSRWQQFEKFRFFCEDNGIDPIVYLSAQFSRSVFDSSNKNNKSKSKVLPFVNALMSASSYEVFKQYCEYQMKVSYLYAAYKHIPVKFGDDFVIQALKEAYETAESGVGLLHYRYAVDDFLTGFGSSDKEEALLEFYRITEENLRKQGVSLKTRDTIKKFVLLQSLILSGGCTRLPGYMILGAEHTQVVLASIAKMAKNPEDAKHLKAKALGLFTHPDLPAEEQLKKGKLYLYQNNALDETPKILSLIMERKNLHLSLADLNAAFSEYGKEKIPVDDFSVMDVDQIVNFVENELYQDKEEEVAIDHSSITDTREWELIGGSSEVPDITDELAQFLESNHDT